MSLSRLAATMTATTTHTTLLFLLLNTMMIIQTNSIPMKFSITKSNKECLYSSANKDEYITTSLFITDGADLKARMMIQGPITSQKISSSAEVLAAGLRFEKGSGFKNLALNIDTNVDFETLYDNIEESIDDDFEEDDDHDDDAADDVDDAILEEYYYMDDDDEYEFMEDDSMDDVELTEIRKAKSERDSMSEKERLEIKAKRKNIKMERFKRLQMKKEEKRMKKQNQQMQKDKRRAVQKENQMKDRKQQLRSGEPLQKTFQVTEEGWYRYCIAPISDVIEVEMELRKSSEVGMPNAKTGHLQTYEHHDMVQQEKKLLKRMTKVNLEENGVKEEDLQITKKQITKLNKLMYDIKDKQMHERHRLSVHKAVNEHSHSRMVLNSLFETIFYIGVSAFQVYTIRKWFTGSPILSY